MAQMGKSELKAVMILILMLGVFQNPSYASIKTFPVCYAACFGICIIDKSWPTCAVKCIVDCIKKTPMPTPISKFEDAKSCTMESAKVQCAHISTRKDSRAKEVSKCVDSCAKHCSWPWDLEVIGNQYN
ncbi:hypothetical protein QQ045_032718 [Rhodiola kirilowii]